MLGMINEFQIFKKVINVLKKMLLTNRHAKLIGNIRLDLALLENAIPQQDLDFLRQLVDYLYN